MIVKVIDWNSNKVHQDADNADFILERDSWNDFSFYTYYFLHTRLISLDNSYTMIGGLRILKRGQEKDELFLLNEGVIQKLSNDFCSLGTSIDYYERISQLEENSKNELLDFLNDIIKKPSIVDLFKDESGFQMSLLRDITLEDDIFDLAPIILTGKYENLPDGQNLYFDFITKEMEVSIKFDFSSNEYGNYFDKKSLPNRICVIVGRNGSGKSTLLSKIARVVYSSTEDRNYIKDIGIIEPKGLGFSRIINISYSAFDSFQVPGITVSEKKQISEEMDNNKGRYIYCGVRDVCKEVEAELEFLKTNKYGKIELESILNDKYEFNFLKPLNSLNDEFLYAWTKILENSKKKELLLESLRELSEEPSLNFLNNIEISDVPSLSERSFYTNLSTGHKFVIHSVFKLIHHIEKRTLVLFDEPESHLHPPLLAVLMKVLRNILDTQKSFMIITTHSPVVVQETLQKHVFMIRREGNVIKTFPAQNQTFGENIGLLTSDIFGLSTEYTDYHTDLDKIISSYRGEKDNFENYISELFDNSISMQAYAYLISGYKNKSN